MKKTLFLLFLFFSTSCLSQTTLESVPIHIGKYPMYMVSKYENKKLDPILIPSTHNYIIVSENNTEIIIDNNVMHKFNYFSIPRSGIEYTFYDEQHQTDVDVFIMYNKDEKTKDKYFGFFVRYNNTLEYVFTYKTGTQITE